MRGTARLAVPVAAAVGLSGLVAQLPHAVAATAATSPAPASPVDNPYAGARQYVNHVWSDQVEKIAAPISSMTHFALLDAASMPTAVWLTSARDVTDATGLAAHLDAALEQQRRSGGPLVMTLVLNARPTRHCGWALDLDDPGALSRTVATYRSTVLTPLATLLGKPAYSGLRFAVVVEPGSVTEAVNEAYPAVQACAGRNLAAANVPLTTAALDTLTALPSTYVYLDGGSAGTLGWDDSLARAVAVWEQEVKPSIRGKAAVAGFAVNVADYGAWQEPFLDISRRFGDLPERSARFLDWSVAADEKSYTDVLRLKLQAAGWPSSVGFVVDTSRNGWGGPARPAAASTSTDVTTFVDESRVDRRASRFMWCNQAGAGMGMRPVPSPAPGVDAFVWVKNPGLSDGVSAGPDALGYPGPKACDPAYAGPLSFYKLSGALPNAPQEGVLFPDHLIQLVVNAWPPLQGMDPPTSSTTRRPNTTDCLTSKTRKTKTPRTRKSSTTTSTKPKPTKTKTKRTKTRTVTATPTPRR
ncbi:MAG: glycoside hydrolase family 6 protein [Kineosporiaceae bacterium]